MNYFRLWISFGFVVLSGCATSVNVNLPSTRFDSPEVLGTGGDFELGAVIYGANKIQLVSDAASRPPVQGELSYGQSLAASANGYLGLAERLDMRFSLGLAGDDGLSMVPPTVGIKLQVLGDPAASAKKGNLSLSLSAGAGVGTSTQSGDQMVLFGPGGFPWESEATTYFYELGAILGTRVSDTVLMYGASYFSYHDIRVKVHQSRSDDGSSLGGDYEYTFDGKMLSGHFGFIFSTGKVYSFGVETAYIDNKFRDQRNGSGLFIGVQNRFNW